MLKSIKIKGKLSILNVSSIEHEITLIKEGEDSGGEVDAKESYFRGLDFINNLKL